MNKVTDKKEGTKTIYKAISILKSFTPATPFQSQAEIARKLGLPVPTTARILKILLDEGLLYRDEETKKFRLGYLISNLGAIAQETIPLKKISLPVMEELRTKFNETVILMVREGNFRLCYETLESHLPLKISVKMGTKNIIWAGASSKIFLAYMEKSEREHFLEEIRPITAYTITDKRQMMREIEKVKKWKVAISQSERKEGYYSVASPIFNTSGKLEASLTLVAPAFRITDYILDEMMLQTRAGAEKISEGLGFRAIS